MSCWLRIWSLLISLNGSIRRPFYPISYYLLTIATCNQRRCPFSLTTLMLTIHSRQCRYSQPLAVPWDCALMKKSCAAKPACGNDRLLVVWQSRPSLFFFNCALLLQHLKPSPYQSCLIKAWLQRLNCFYKQLFENCFLLFLMPECEIKI